MSNYWIESQDAHFNTEAYASVSYEREGDQDGIVLHVPSQTQMDNPYRLTTRAAFVDSKWEDYSDDLPVSRSPSVASLPHSSVDTSFQHIHDQTLMMDSLPLQYQFFLDTGFHGQARYMEFERVVGPSSFSLLSQQEPSSSFLPLPHPESYKYITATASSEADSHPLPTILTSVRKPLAEDYLEVRMDPRDPKRKAEFYCTYHEKHVVPYGKEKCDFHSPRSDTGRRHINTVHLELRPFSCDRCDRVFSNKQGLKIHYTKHTGEKPWGCPDCAMRFNDPSKMYKHRAKYHNYVQSLRKNEDTYMKVKSRARSRAKSRR